jgi:hypothetical protein
LPTPLYTFGNNYQKRIQTQQIPYDLLTRISFPLQTVGLAPFSTFPSILNPFTNWKNTNYYNFEALSDLRMFNNFNFDASTSSNIVSSMTMLEPLNLNSFLSQLNEIPIYLPTDNKTLDNQITATSDNSRDG